MWAVGAAAGCNGTEYLLAQLYLAIMSVGEQCIPSSGRACLLILFISPSAMEEEGLVSGVA
jgi:hypothetical protein